MSKTAIHVATKAFRAEIDGETIDVAEGERVIAGHALISRYPQHFRARQLREELAIRSRRVEELREQAARPASREPVSEAGRAARREEDFWRSTRVMLERTREDQPTSEERREQAFFDRALAQIEDVDTRELAEVNADAVRAYGFDRGWSRRVAD